MTYNELCRLLYSCGIGDCDECRLEADILFEHFFGLKKYELLSRKNENFSSSDFEDALKRRCKHQPLQYILGEWEFFGIPLFVSPDCLIPRADTEISVETAIKNLPKGALFADLGTGSGAITIAILKSRSDLRAVSVDISPGALKIAERNAERHKLSDRITFIEADMLSPDFFNSLLNQCGRLDAIISNPPYIPSKDLEPDKIQPELLYEPQNALCGGSDGLDFYRSLIPRIANSDILAPDGFVLFEVGIGEADIVSELGITSGFSACTYKDLGGIDRAVFLRQ